MNIGDLTLKIILDTVDADGKAQKFTGTLKTVEGATEQLDRQNQKTSKGLGDFGMKVFGLKETLSSLRETVSSVIAKFKNVDAEYQNLITSNRVLEATSKLTGIELNVLQNTSSKAKNEFQLNTKAANDFTIVLSKLTGKAGETEKTSQAIKSLLDLGAAQGLGGEQTLVAIQQAVLGIDEGTDKLFQKNPIVIYQEYANKIGTTAGKLTDQQKAQAILNAVIESGEKVQGTYSQRLTTSAGKQEQYNNKLVEAKQKLGEQLNPVMIRAIDLLDKLLSAYNGLNESQQKAIFFAGLTGGALFKLIPIIVPLISHVKNLTTATNALGASNGINSFAGNIISKLGGGSMVSLVLAGVLASIITIDEALSRYNERWNNGALDSNGNLMKGKIISDPGNLSFGPGLYGDKLTAQQQKQIDNLKTIGQLKKELEALDKSALTGEALTAANLREKYLNDEIDKLNKQGLPDEKKRSGSGNGTNKKKEEIVNELTELRDRIKEINKSLSITPEGTTLFEKYTKQVAELNTEIEFLSKQLLDVQKLPESLQPGTLNDYGGGEFSPITGERTPIAPQTLSDGERIMLYGKDKEKEQQKIISSESFQSAEFMLKNLGGTLEGALNDAFSNSINNAENLIVKLFINLASGLLGKLFNYGISSILNSIFPGSGIIASIFGGARAAGGPVSSGLAYLVGERGPELFMPTVGGSILNSYDSSRMLAKSVNRQTTVIREYVPGELVLKNGDLHAAWDVAAKRIERETT